MEDGDGAEDGTISNYIIRLRGCWAVGCGSLAISSLLTFMTSRGEPNNHANRNQCPGAAHPSSYTHFLWKHTNAQFKC